MRGWWEGKRECWRSKGAELLEEMTIAEREWGGGSGWVGGEVLQNTQMAKQERF